MKLPVLPSVLVIDQVDVDEIVAVIPLLVEIISSWDEALALAPLHPEGHCAASVCLLVVRKLAGGPKD
eukprot:3426331-Prorocentrum_lima.AAC.1